jgi:hypothetical protein
VRRILPVLVGALVVVGGIVAVLSYVHGRDEAGLDQGAESAAAGPGTLEADRGAAHRDGAAVGRRSTPPPTSGAHEPRPVTDERTAGDAALLHAMELGDVVIAYPGSRPPPALTALREDVSGPFDPELAAAGQTIILVPRPDLGGIQALAWRRRLEASGPDDPQLRAFAEAWLGKGRGNTG